MSAIDLTDESLLDDRDLLMLEMHALGWRPDQIAVAVTVVGGKRLPRLTPDQVADRIALINRETDESEAA